MRKIFFTIAFFIILLFTFSSCMSTRHLGHDSPGEGNHSNQRAGNYSISGGAGHSGGCH